MEAERRKLPKAKWVTRLASVAPCFAQCDSSLVPRARRAETLAHFDFDELLATLMVNI
jgi:hypothetical protein